MKSIPRLVWIVPMILLLLTGLPLPHGYYTFTRIVVCGAAASIAVPGFRERPVSLWSLLLTLIAVLFNPIIPISLSRPIWGWLGFGAAALFAGHLIFIRYAPHEPRRASRVVAFVALALAMTSGTLLLLLGAWAITNVKPWTALDTQSLAWVVGIGLFFVVGGSILIYRLVKHPILKEEEDERRAIG